MLKFRLNRLILYKFIWLVGLSVFFFASYNFANWLSSTRDDVGCLVFDWEVSIPLLPWSIVPYWSIDFMYGLAILLTNSRQSLKTLCLRLLSAQIICIICFLSFPLKFSFERPALDGLSGWLFDVLMGFDKPFNQAPSLHITLLVILWAFYNNYLNSYCRYLLHIWCLLIGVSVLTTWQHHFFDIPTGLWVGCFCIWLWPANDSSPLKNCQLPKQYLWSYIYFVCCLLSFGLAIYIQTWGLWLLWLSGAFLLVSANYLLFGAKGFQKQTNGHFNLAVTLLYFPYFIIMWINSRLWTYKCQAINHIYENIYLGRIPSTNVLTHNKFITVIDLCAELPIGKFDGNYVLVPILDMTPLTSHDCSKVATIIEHYQSKGKLLVDCALGYSRSATAIIAWLLWTNQVNNVDDAINMVKQSRQHIVISEQQRRILINWFLQTQNRK
ncbi:phosphatase PAP2/dual specificity phosphatase family protein [Gilliamella sp. wkB112]|uniref:phosphatase PAP2/dual specificity phosphatase family protein n=1 Tax=Gilliamella sp. wkB112 TaxID=3120257 RepID=UPI00080DD251|nr:phosphatase PAP2/dual specificity phosphatase family protein [Gilliamella apicola]OCG03265.1 hypothetical protein A9G12_08555 [Gilliamella apicola]